MSTRIVKIEIIPTVVWDNGDSLIEVPVKPMTVHGPDIEEYFFNGKIADELVELDKAIMDQFSHTDEGV